MATIDYSPAEVNLRGVNVGDDFSQVLNVSGDRSAYTFAASLRPKASATETAFTVAVGAYSAPNTPVTLTLTDTVTSGLAAGDYVWDMQWTDASSLVLTVASGWLTVIADVA